MTQKTALRSPLCVIARNVAISPFRSRQTEKREIASQARKETTVASAALEMTQMKASAGLSGRRARVCDLFPSLSAFSALNPKLLYTINYIKELPQAGKVG